MSNNNYSNYENDMLGTNPRNFSGLIFTSDFNTEYKKDNYNGSPIAARIESDWKFDRYLDKLKEKKGNLNNENK